MIRISIPLIARQPGVPLKRPKPNIIYGNLVMSKAHRMYTNHSETVLYSPKGGIDTYGQSFNVEQNTTLENFREIFRHCIDALKPKKGEVISLGDYGSANGKRTMKLFDDAIGFIREKHGEDRQISTVYNDLPGNDFNDLFMRLNGTKSYRKDLNGIFPAAVGKSFYEQIVPANSMDIIFSCHALHYLDKLPCKIKHGLSIHDATSEEYKQFKDAAAHDWEKFLLHRAIELKPGGSLILAVPALSDVCQEFSQKAGIILKGAWNNLLRTSIITEEEYVNATINTYLRTEDELRLPFNSNKSLVSSCGLELAIMTINPAVYLKYEKKHEDVFPRKEFEQHLCDGVLSVIHGDIYHALSPSRTNASKLSVMAAYKKEILRYVQEQNIDSYEFARADIVFHKRTEAFSTTRC